VVVFRTNRRYSRLHTNPFWGGGSELDDDDDDDDDGNDGGGAQNGSISTI
jgi:hypothetical protein